MNLRWVPHWSLVAVILLTSIQPSSCLSKRDRSDSCVLYLADAPAASNGGDNCTTVERHARSNTLEARTGDLQTTISGRIRPWKHDASVRISQEDFDTFILCDGVAGGRQRDRYHITRINCELKGTREISREPSDDPKIILTTPSTMISTQNEEPISATEHALPTTREASASTTERTSEKREATRKPEVTTESVNKAQAIIPTGDGGKGFTLTTHEFTRDHPKAGMLGSELDKRTTILVTLCIVSSFVILLGLLFLAFFCRRERSKPDHRNQPVNLRGLPAITEAEDEHSDAEGDEERGSLESSMGGRNSIISHTSGRSASCGASSATCEAKTASSTGFRF